MGTTNKNSCKTAAVMGLLSRGSAEGRPTRGIVPNLGTTGGREQIEYIDIDRLDDDPNNFYALSGLEELAANIELLGLQQPIRVRPGEEQGRYIIVSGHRRRAAVRLLVMEGRGDLRDLPCIVDRGEASAALQELRLIYANSDTRKMTSAELNRQAERVEELLYQLKEEGYVFPGRMRDHVAEACKVSRSKLSRLKVIRENLNPGWYGKYESGELNESAAYTLAQMPEKRQMILLSGLQDRKNIYEHDLSRYGESLAQVEKIVCERQGGGPCVNLESMQDRILHNDSWNNQCRQCCGDCPELARCKRVCPMLADKIAQLKADAKAEQRQKKQAEEETMRPKIEAVRQLWTRFGQARTAAGKSVEDCYQAFGVACTEAVVQTHEKLERLEEKITENTNLPCGFPYELKSIQKYRALADLLGVSLDYLLCRADDPEGMAPAAAQESGGWMPGGSLPLHPCDVVADFDIGDGAVSRVVCRFDGEVFRFRGNGATIEAEPVRWTELPPVGEDAP